MWWRLLSIALLAGSVAACAPLAGQQQTGAAPPPAAAPTVFSHRVSTTQVVLYWNCTRPESGQLRMEGLAYDPYFPDVRDLQFKLVGVDSSDRVVSETWGVPRHYDLGLSRTSPFQLTLRSTGTEVRFDLSYGYLIERAPQSGDVRPWLVAGPSVGVGPYLLAELMYRFTVRDACSGAQHQVSRMIR
jgi:hypothetical protein